MNQLSRPSLIDQLRSMHFGTQTRLTVGLILLSILTSGLVAAIVFIAVRNQLRQDIRQRLENMITIAALQIDVDGLDSLTEPDQMESEPYRRIQSTMLAIRSTSSDIAYLYTMRKNAEGEISYIVDASDNPSKLGDIYENPSANLAVNFDTLNQPLIEQDFYTNQSGTWLSGYVPLYTSDGRREIVLGMDLTAESVITRENQLLMITILAFLLTLPVAGAVGWLLGRTLTRPILSLAQGTRRIAAGDFSYQVNIQTGDERQELAEAINAMTRRARETVDNLGARVLERTQEVETHALYLEAASDVARSASSILNSDQLMQEVVEKIRSSFDMYYVGLFLLDETREWAVLRSGTGEAGQRMIARGHRRKVGDGMIGWSIANNQARVASEARQDFQRLSTAELPETRSEAALPLRSRGQVIGAITVQSTRLNDFNPRLITVLQTMADQVAVALDNARLYAESSEAVKALERANQELNRQVWSNLLQRLSPDAQVVYQADEQGVKRADSKTMSDLPPDAADSTVLPADVLSIPIRIRGTVLGYLQAEKPPAADGSSQAWTPEEATFIQGLVEQLEVALDNARLYSATQQSAARERIISEITSKVRASTSINTILQTAAQELALALRLPATSVQLRPLDSDDNV